MSGKLNLAHSHMVLSQLLASFRYGHIPANATIKFLSTPSAAVHSGNGDLTKAPHTDSGLAPIMALYELSTLKLEKQN